MNVSLLFFINALFVVDVKCGCDHYIDCFTEFLQEFLGTNTTNVSKKDGDNFRHKHIELDEKNEDFDKIIEDLTVLIKDVNANVNEHSVKKHDNNKTQIHVKIFDFHNDAKKDFTTESTSVTDDGETTTEGDLSDLSKDFVKFPDILLDNANMLPFETTTPGLNVIPLVQSDIDNEIFSKYDFEDDLDDNSTDYQGIDYLELYKDTTNEDIDYIPTEPPLHLSDAIQQNEQDIENLIEESLNLIQDEFLNNLLKNITKHTIESCNGDKLLVTSAVFPWIATIFLKNESKGDQFDYFCDGALISDKIVLTAARCVFSNNSVINPENFIVILGKTSLQVSSGEEKILKVSSVKPHANFTFTGGIAANDLAILVLEDPVLSSEGVATACLQTEDKADDEDVKDSFTTAWSLLGDLTLVYFDKEKSKACGSSNKVENTFCATYGNDVVLCPSYGGLYVTISADRRLHLQGLRTGNPHDTGVCYDKNVNYTALKSYHKWIQDTIAANK